MFQKPVWSRNRSCSAYIIILQYAQKNLKVLIDYYNNIILLRLLQAKTFLGQTKFLHRKILFTFIMRWWRRANFLRYIQWKYRYLSMHRTESKKYNKKGKAYIYDKYLHITKARLLPPTLSKNLYLFVCSSKNFCLSRRLLYYCAISNVTVFHFSRTFGIFHYA